LCKDLSKIYGYPFKKNLHQQRWHTPILKGIPEIVFCPREFDFPRKQEPNLVYLDAGIDLNRKEAEFNWAQVNLKKPLIFCTLGSLSIPIKGSLEFFQKIVSAFSETRDYTLILSCGKRNDPSLFQNIPKNIHIFQFVPQLEILKKSAMMINHGGFNTVKECILLGIPMLVYPFVNDGISNGARIKYHGLGMIGRWKKDSPAQILKKTEIILNCSSFKTKISDMQQCFRNAQSEKSDLEILQGFLK